MHSRSILAAALVILSAVAFILLPRTASTALTPLPDLGWACQQGCNNDDGCSWPFGKYTRWYPHVECRLTIGAITCRDSQDVALCYRQWKYSNPDCTGNLTQYIEHRTPLCVPL